MDQVIESAIRNRLPVIGSSTIHQILLLCIVLVNLYLCGRKLPKDFKSCLRVGKVLWRRILKNRSKIEEVMELYKDAIGDMRKHK